MKRIFSYACRLVSLLPFFCVVAVLIPSSVLASTSVPLTDILQATSMDFSSNNQVIWQSNQALSDVDQNNFSLDNIKALSVVSGPQRMLLVPKISDVMTLSSPITQSSIIQGNSQIPFQGNISSVVSMLSNSSINSALLNFSIVSQNGTILIDKASQTITNKTISGSNNTLLDIPNSALLHSSIKIVGGSGISVSDGTVGLGGTVTISNTSIASAEADTLASVTNRGATTTTALTLSNSSNTITVGTLTATGGTLDGLTIGSTTPSSGKFTTVNGLTIINNGSNTLDIAAGKTLTANNSMNFVGTDGTTLTFPTISDTIAGLSSSQTLTNKTIAAGSNTISGLTNTNLSGSAGIINANLLNSSITVSTGTGISGGATVSLGNTLSLTNTGVTSLTGTANQVVASGSTGSVTLSLPQSIGTASSPSFASLNLSNTSNQLLLGTTNIGTLNWAPSATRTLTLPDTTDTLVGKTTADVLTNKTLTTPTINGTVGTTGLTLPGFTLSGNITGSGSPTISNFGAINGLTLSLSSIQPASSGTLTIQSNGANALTMDTGSSGATINIGNTNAVTVGMGNTSSTFNLSGNFDQSGSSGTFKTATGAATLNGDTTIASAKSLAVTTADKLTVGGTIIPQTIPISVPLSSTLLTQPVFIADTTYQVTGAKCVPSVLSISGTFQVTVDSGTQAAGAGTSQLTGTISLSGTANTVVSGTLIGSPTTINAGDRVTAKLAGVLTGLLGNCTIYIKRV